jgi:hypothetical protein
MARTLVFCDSFDHYSDLTQKYAGGGSSVGIDLTGTKSRTGIGCLNGGGPFGPELAVPGIRGNAAGYMASTQYFQPGTGESQDAGIITFIDVDPGSGDITFLFRFGINSDLGITCIDCFNNICAVSPNGIAVANSYNLLEVKVFFLATLQGSAIIRLNGQVVTWATGGLSAINTLDPSRDETGGQCNNIRLGGASASWLQDDFTLYNSTSHAADDFLGPVGVYEMVPEGNGTPLQWSPLAGTNFSEVNHIPPVGDAAYVSSTLVGNIDQYVYVPADTPPSGIPPGSIIYGAQHSLLSRVDSGSASVESSISSAGGSAVGAVYHYVPITPFDINPTTGNPWALTDFPATQIGPKQTL